MPTYTVALNDKPRDLLVTLVDDGPQTAIELSERFGGLGIYTGGLTLLLELRLVQFERDHSKPPVWFATDDGRQLVERARERAATELPASEEAKADA